MKYDKPTLKSNINTELADNATQQISPNDVRHNLLDIIDSVHSISYTSGTELFTSNFATPDLRSTKAGRETLSKLYLDGYSSTDNSAFGYSALAQNYDGQRNTGAGSYALSCNVYGSNNTAIGYNALAGNIRGSGNVGLGPHTLRTNKDGMFNIAVGHGAGYFIGSGASYKFFLGSYDVDDDSLCGEGATSGTNPLLYGELDNLRLGVGVQSLHDYGNLQVSGSVSPALSGQFDLGHQLYPWSAAHISDSINDDIYFSGGYLGIGTASPSGTEGLVTVGGTVVPNYTKAWDLGRPDLMWRGGYFENIVVSGTAAFDVFTYREIESCLYECRTLYLATSGICEGNAPCGYLTDESLEGAGLVVPSSGTDYTRNYKWIFQAPDSTITCLEQDTPNSRASWHSNISIDVASGSHVRADRILGRENLSLVSDNNCFGIFIKKDDKTIRAGTVGRNEKQTISVDATGGTFTLTFGGQTTSALAFDATGAVVQAALEALSSIGSGNVTVSGSRGGTVSVYAVEFVGTLASSDQAQITATSSLTKGGSSSAGGAGNRRFYVVQQNQIQDSSFPFIRFTRTGRVTGGAFKIRLQWYNNQPSNGEDKTSQGGAGNVKITTKELPWNATAGQICEALNESVRKISGTWDITGPVESLWYNTLASIYFYPPTHVLGLGGPNNHYRHYPSVYSLVENSSENGYGKTGQFGGCSPEFPIHGRVPEDKAVDADGDLFIQWNTGWRNEIHMNQVIYESNQPISAIVDNTLVGGTYAIYQPKNDIDTSSSNQAKNKYGNGTHDPNTPGLYIQGATHATYSHGLLPSGHPIQFDVYDVQFDGGQYTKSSEDFNPNGTPKATVQTIHAMNNWNTNTLQLAFDEVLGAGKVRVSGVQQHASSARNDGVWDYSDTSHNDLLPHRPAQTDWSTRLSTHFEDFYSGATTASINYYTNYPGNHFATTHLHGTSGVGGWTEGHDKIVYGGFEIEFLGTDMQNKWLNVSYSDKQTAGGSGPQHSDDLTGYWEGRRESVSIAVANSASFLKSLVNVGDGTGSSASSPTISIATNQDGSVDISAEVKKTSAMFVAEEADITPSPIGPNGTVAGITDVNFIGGSGADDNDYVVTYSSLTSGVVVGQRLTTRASNKTQTNELDNLTGFAIDFIDTKDEKSATTGQSKDRLSIAGYNNNPFALNAMTIMKSNFPGLVGISNIPDVAADVLPETIFNIQATGDATVRVTAGHGDDASIQILAGENSDCDNGNPHNGFETVYTASGDYKFTDFNIYEDCDKCTVMRFHGCMAGVGLGSGQLPEYTFHIAGDYPKLGLQTTGSTRDGYIYSKPTSETLADGTVRTCDHLWWHSNCGDVQLSTQRTQDHVNITNLVGRQDLISGGETSMTNGGVGEFWDQNNPYGGDSSSDIYMGDDYIDLAGNSMGQMAGLGRGNFGGSNEASAFDPMGGFDDLMGNIEGIGGATNNTGQGFGAAAGLTTGSSNTAFGAAAGASTSIGSCNTFVGVNAGRNITTGNRNVAVGCEALYTSHADVDYNIFIGTKLPQNSNNDWVLQIGHGPETPGTLIPGPILSGSLGPAVADKHLFVLNKLTVPNINNTDAITFNHDQNLFGTDKVASVIQKDDNSSDYPDGGVAFRFKGANGDKNDLMTLRHHVEPMTRASSFNTPSPERPVVEVKGDLNVLGAIRFHDGTSLESGVGVSILPGSGLGSFLNSNGETEFKLDVEDLPTAPVLSTSGSYIAVGTSGNTQRVSLLELDQQLSSGANYILANHNHAVTNTSDINTSINSYTNLMGYRAGDDIIQSNYSVFIGPEAGANDGNAVSGSYSSAFIGHRAGMNAGSADNSVFMGPNAGHNASGSRMSVFVGNSAGLNAKSSRSVGIGDNALEAVSGDRNIEITVGMGGADPYRLITGTTSNKLNVGDMIGGDMSTKRLSVGNATLSPSGTFDVRAPASGVGTLAPHVQTWWNHNGAMVAYLDHDGNMFIKGTVQTIS